MRRVCWSIIFCCALACTQSAATEPLRYDISGSGNWYPYYIDNSQHPGILADIIGAILARAGIPGEMSVMPAKRINYALYKQLIDFEVISPEWLTTAEKNDPAFVFSIPFLTVSEYLVTLSSHKDQFTSRDVLVGKPVGTVRGYVYHDDNRFTRVDFQSERELVLALEKHRIKVAIIGDLPARHWAKTLGVEIAFGALHSEGKLHMRLLKKHAPLLEKINQAILSLEQDGSLQRILARYSDH